MTNRPPNDTIKTAKRSTKSLITASPAATGWTDNLAMVSLTKTGQADSTTVSLAVTRQTESSGVGATTQRGAEADTAAPGGSAAEAATPGGTRAGPGVDSRTGTSSRMDS